MSSLTDQERNVLTEALGKRGFVLNRVESSEDSKVVEALVGRGLLIRRSEMGEVYTITAVGVVVLQAWYQDMGLVFLYTAEDLQKD